MTKSCRSYIQLIASYIMNEWQDKNFKKINFVRLWEIWTVEICSAYDTSFSAKKIKWAKSHINKFTWSGWSVWWKRQLKLVAALKKEYGSYIYGCLFHMSGTTF